MVDDVIHTVPYTNAVKFFDEFLSPTTNLQVKGSKPGSFAFRGHSDASWGLIPSAFRQKSWLTDGRFWKGGGTMNRAQQVRFEAQTLREFFNASDRQGLRLPEDGQDLRLIFDKLSNIERLRDANQFHKEFGIWPPNKLLSLMALAQHSGVPTRLIDWSWSAYVAAYFAASGSVKESTASPELAVWRVNLELIRRIQLRSSEFGAQPDLWPVRIISAPAADNINLRAQQGLFTLHSIAGNSSPLTENSLENTVTTLVATSSAPCPWILVKATLPSSEACKLLSLLRQHGSHAASLFPTFSGVAEFMTEQRRITGSQKRDLAPAE